MFLRYVPVSSRGQDTWFSATGPGFESPYRYHPSLAELTLSELRMASHPATAAPGLGVRADDVENRQYREASPLTHVTADDPPMLLMHGDQDTIVPIKLSE